LYRQGEKCKALQIASRLLKKEVNKHLAAETGGLLPEQIEKLANKPEGK
jgi:hypothetical protein